jgi:Cupin-like domain
MTSYFTDSKPKPMLPDHILEADSQNFRQNFNKASFQCSHTLAGHPLFEIPRLVELARLLVEKGGRQKVHSSGSDVSAHQKWSDMPWKEQFDTALSQINESGSLIILKTIQLDPEYDAMVKQIVDELAELTGIPLWEEITWLEGYIFVSSPDSLTPYHLDHESNFLLQIQGEKDVSLFDQSDRAVLTEEEIEHYFIGDLQAATYKEENQSGARVYHLSPGIGVHHPPKAPHWVKNGNQYSVSLSINFCLRSYDLQARVYQVNHYLRKLGLHPTPPDQSRFKDRVKQAFIGLFSKRKPDIKMDVVFSGVDRIKAPFLMLQNTVSRMKR